MEVRGLDDYRFFNGCLESKRGKGYAGTAGSHVKEVVLRTEHGNTKVRRYELMGRILAIWLWTEGEVEPLMMS
jgi:hypothetical protein